MKTAAIICEYNPFHNGHEYHIMQTRNITGADYVIAIMSGNYVQRGTPAVMDKKIRTKSALLGGADLVIELPFLLGGFLLVVVLPLFAGCSSAPDFAIGAVSLLHKLGVIDYLSFGSECQDINKLKQIASFLIQYEEEIERGTKELMSLGHSYPKAKELYLREHLDDASLIEVLKQPNNILGIEYLKALLQLDSPIIPVCVTRVSNDHHSKELTPSISSATSIREILEQNQISPLFSRVPEALHDIYQMHYQKDFPVCLDDFSLLLHAAIYSCEDLTQISGISSDFKDRIFKMLKSDLSFEELISACKTKNLTWSKISRNLLHIMLDITKEKVEKARTYDMSPYFQILGFKRSASFLIGNIKRKSSIPMVRHLRVMNDPLSKDQEELLSTEQRANQLYRTVIGQKFHTIIKDEQIIF